MNEPKEVIVNSGMHTVSSAGQYFQVTSIATVAIFIFIIIYSIISFRKKSNTAPPSKINGRLSLVVSIVSCVIFYYTLNIAAGAGLAAGVVFVVYFPIILAGDILSIVFSIKSFKHEAGINRTFGLIGFILAIIPIFFVLQRLLLLSLVR